MDTGVAHAARVYDYWLGGTANFAADREAAEQAIAADPGIVPAVRASRAFLARTVRYLAGAAGLRQFLDIGAGIPAGNNTHEVAQSVAPDSRVVYADSDPLVLAHAQHLLRNSPGGECAYIFADLRDPDGIRQQAAATLDAGLPVAVMLAGVLQYVPDADDPHALVAKLMADAPSGSYLVVSHPASDMGAAQVMQSMDRYAGGARGRATPRSHAGVTRFFDGLQLLEPGVVPVSQWRPDPGAAPGPLPPVWGGAGRKP
ncbi:MAG: SAM-dependent methyltransferase [Actinobacteria bacterium]|nr:SAM-dependent methyltransferase [Actinomycetota bacterium]